jgi:glycosyltransferase involved in cell wall biosynthesis
LKQVRKHPPLVLQSQHFFANAYVGIVARLLRVKSIGAMRNDGRSEVAGSGASGGWLNLHLPQTLAANSQTAIEYAVSRGVPASRLYFLPNVVDTERFKPANHSDNAPLILIAVGRLVKQKRLDRFICLISRLRREFNLDAEGWMVGPAGPDQHLKTALETQARDLGLLPERLKFLGGVSDMASVYRRGAVCVLTSDFEGTPNVLLEAMATGLPVVATRVGGVPDIVRHGQTGFLLAPDDLDGLTTALARLAQNLSLRSEMGNRARAYVEDHHSLRHLPGWLGDLYQMALPAEQAGLMRTVRPESIVTGQPS